MASYPETAEGRLGAIALELRRELEGAGAAGEEAVAWTLRLLAHRCLEARGLRDEGLLDRLDPPRSGEATPRRCLTLLSGAEAPRGHEPATAEIFRAPDALGWAYQALRAGAKQRLFDRLRTTKGGKVGGADLLPATCVYTPSHLVRFLLENSLGALWMGLHPGSRLMEGRSYYLPEAKPPPLAGKPARAIRFLDPACGSGNFLLGAFDLLYAMYEEEGELRDPAAICASIFEHNLHGIDLDGQAVRLAVLALAMKAQEKAPGFVPGPMHLVATDRATGSAETEVAAFLREHPDDAPFAPALLRVFEGLARLDELGALVRIEEPLGAHPAEREVLLGRLRRHLAPLPGAAGLVELLGRRYDVIAVNPPYVGFRKLARHLTAYVTKADPLASLDLFVAFLSRFFPLVAEGGSLAAVSPSSWTTSSRTTALRRAMLDAGGPRVIAALGQRVFEDAPLLFVSLSILDRGLDRAQAQGRGQEPSLPGARVTTLRPKSLSGAEGLLRAVRQGGRRWPREVIRRFETLPFLPIAPMELLEAAREQPTVGDFFSFADGVWTGSSDRDVREAWEVPRDDGEWLPASGGQGYSRWYAPLSRRLRARFAREWPSLPARSFALEYARVAGGKLAARVIEVPEGGRPSAALAGVVSLLPKEGVDPLRLWEAAAVFNCRLGTVWLRTLTSGLNFNPGYAGRIPLAPWPPPAELARAVRRIVAAKAALARREMSCDDFDPAALERAGEGSPADRAERWCAEALEETARVLEEEAAIEGMLKAHLGISEEAWGEIEQEIGAPVAALDAGPATIAQPVAGGEAAFAGEPLAAVEAIAVELELELELEVEVEAEDEEAARVLPAESDLERLARACGRSPRALLGDGLPEPIAGAVLALRRKRRQTFAADLVSLLVLRRLGHRWPAEESEASEAPEGGGAFLLLAGDPGEPTLANQLREPLRRIFPGREVEREMGELLGKPLDRWLLTELFRYHTVGFRRRPVAWQIHSARATAGRKPAFAALLSCQRLGPATLSTLLDRVRAPHRARVPELATFAARLEEVLHRGFDCAALAAAAEPLDAWTAPEEGAAPPPSREAFLAQERRYAPHPRDGVRVNVAPLQRAGLLSSEVLPATDLEGAIADRAAWRAEERRRCRAGAQARPGWWRR